MKKIFIPLVLIIAVVILLAVISSKTKTSNSPSSSVVNPNKSSSNSNGPQTQVIAEKLDTPWAIAFLPDESMLVTERPGRVRLIDAQGNLYPNPVVTLPKVKEIGEGGLLGIVLHPNFATNHYVYLYYTYSKSSGNSMNRVVRMTYQDKKLTDEHTIIDAIPGNSNHDGGRIKFGPDGLLYITTGDAENPSQAQDTKALGGKILRITDEGKIPSGNPFGNAIYTYGHRNPQGLAWNSQGQLFETEHGRSIPLSGFDEINILSPGKNYGWPTIQGDEKKQGMVTPIRNSGASTTWAPSGAAFVGSSLFFSGLKGQALYEAVIKNGQVVDFKEHLKGQYGRIREVILGPDNMLYISTSNNDGRGKPVTEDDRIIRINVSKL